MVRWFELHGHRGARGLFPENTLSGFARTLDIGVNALEMDVAVTSDDVVVVTHDPRLNPDLTRDEDGGWLIAPTPAIRSLSADQLSRYDVGRIRPGSAYAARFADQTPDDGAAIPRLADALRLDEGVLFNIELKSIPAKPHLAVDGAALADAVLAVVDATGTEERVILQSFDWRGPRRVRRTRPDLRVSWLTSAAVLASARIWWDGPHPSDYAGSVPRAVAAEGGRNWGPEHVDLTPEILGEAHALGLRVIPWTVNRPGEMRRLIRWGVDGLITDRPDLARRVMAEEGLALPAQGGLRKLA